MITAVSDISIHMLTTSIDNNFNLKNYAQALGLAVFYCGLVSIVLLLSPLGPVPETLYVIGFSYLSMRRHEMETISV